MKKIRKLAVAIDVDETLGDFLTAVTDYFNQTHKKQVKIKDYHNYQMHEAWGVTHDEAHKIVKGFFDDGYAYGIKPIHDSTAVVRRLSKCYELSAVSARMESQRHVTEMWLDRYYPNLFGNLYLTDGFHRGNSKADLMLQHGIGLLIDDHPIHIADCCNKRLSGLLYGNYPWNSDSALPRARSWKHVEEILF